MKMILKVELFASAEAEEVSAGDLKRRLAEIATDRLKDSLENLGMKETFSYNTLEGRKLKAAVKWLTESEAYNSLK